MPPKLLAVANFEVILKSARTDLNAICLGLTEARELNQEVQFCFAKLEAQLQSLEGLLLEHQADNKGSALDSGNSKKMAALHKLIPEFYFDLQKFGSKSGLEKTLGALKIKEISSIFALNSELQEILLAQ